MDGLSFGIGCAVGLSLLLLRDLGRKHNEDQAYRTVFTQAQDWADLCARLRRKGWRIITPGLVADLVESLPGKERKEPL